MLTRGWVDDKIKKSLEGDKEKRKTMVFEN